FYFQMIGNILAPIFAEHIPAQHIDAARAQHRPQRHFYRAGIRGRDDAAYIVIRDAEQSFMPCDDVLELRLAVRGAVRAPEERTRQGIEAPARALGTGPGRKIRVGGFNGWLGHENSPAGWEYP